MLKIYRVNGNSMYPTLKDGDYVVAIRFLYKIRTNDLVVANHPRYSTLVKRVSNTASDHKKFYLEGDNQDSVSGEKMGWFRQDQVIGKVIFRIKH